MAPTPRRRFTHWTEENRIRLVEGVRVVSIASAARSCGIGQRTVHEWLARGRKAGEEELAGKRVKKADRAYVDWARLMDAAIGKAEVGGSALILAAAHDKFADEVIDDGKGGKTTVRKMIRRGEWQAMAWWMERRFGKRWGKMRLELTGEDGGPIKLQDIAEVMKADDEAAQTLGDFVGGGSLDE